MNIISAPHCFLTGKNEIYINNKVFISSTQDDPKENE